MDDCIYRKAAIEALNKMLIEDMKAYPTYAEADEKAFNCGICQGEAWSIKCINSLPPADVKPIVLCKNCMCYDSRNFLCEHFNAEMGREDYCSYGY